MNPVCSCVFFTNDRILIKIIYKKNCFIKQRGQSIDKSGVSSYFKEGPF